MPRLPRISDSEWQVMKVFWDRRQATANEVIEALARTADWSPKTIRTLIHRLAEKQALKIRKGGREYVYMPTIEEQDCARAESRSFLARVYGGAITPMLAHFLEEEKLSAAEIAELKRLLNAKRPARKKDPQ